MARSRYESCNRGMQGTVRMISVKQVEKEDVGLQKHGGA
jgi:hypothetical protein